MTRFIDLNIGDVYRPAYLLHSPHRVFQKTGPERYSPGKNTLIDPEVRVYRMMSPHQIWFKLGQTVDDDVEMYESMFRDPNYIHDPILLCRGTIVQSFDASKVLAARRVGLSFIPVEEQ